MQRLDPVTAASGKVGDRQLATAARQAKERRPDLDGRAAGSGVSRASDPDGVEELRAARKLEANAIALPVQEEIEGKRGKVGRRRKEEVKRSREGAER